MAVTCVRGAFGAVLGDDRGLVTLGGCTPGQTLIACWLGGTASRLAEEVLCDGVAMEPLLRATSGPNVFIGDVFALEDVQTSVGEVTFALNAPAYGDVFVLALTPSVLLEAVSFPNAAALSHACAPPNQITTPPGVFLLSLIVQDVGSRVFTPAPGYNAQLLRVTSHLLQTREAADALTAERAIASTNAPTDSQGLLLAYGSAEGAEPEPVPTGAVRIFGSPVFGG